MKKKWIKIAGPFMAALMIVIGNGFSAMTVYAFGGEETTTAADASAAETEKESTPDEKETQVLTPDGNMDLVDDIDGETEMQFLTVTTKDGHYFYIIIERNKDSENVHFLNQVDARDLLNIMSEEEVKEFQEINQNNESTEETTVIIPEPETKPTPETEPETQDTPVTPEKKTANPFKTLGLFVLIGGAVAGGYYFMKIKPSKDRGRYDDDLDFDDDAEYVEDSAEEREPEFHDDEEEEAEQ